MANLHKSVYKSRTIEHCIFNERFKIILLFLLKNCAILRASIILESRCVTVTYVTWENIVISWKRSRWCKKRLDKRKTKLDKSNKTWNSYPKKFNAVKYALHKTMFYIMSYHMKIRYKFLYNISLLGLIHRGSHNTKIIKTSIYVRWSILKSIFEFYMIKETDFITVTKQMWIFYILTFLMVQLQMTVFGKLYDGATTVFQ